MQVTRPRGLVDAGQLGPLLGLALVAGGVFVFIELADEMREGATLAFDSAILASMRQPGDLARPIGPPWLPSAARDITALGGAPVLTLLTLAGLGYLLLLRRFQIALLLAFAMLGAVTLSTVLKIHFQRPRPDIVPWLMDVASPSFPSGHAMMSAVAYLTIAVLIGRSSSSRLTRAYLVGVAVALSILVGLSRIYLGVHWPSDVLAGWCGGASWAFACGIAARWLQRRGAIEGAGASSHAPDVEVATAPAGSAFKTDAPDGGIS